MWSSTAYHSISCAAAWIRSASVDLMGDLSFTTYKARSRARRHNHHTQILCCRGMGGEGCGQAAINTVQRIQIIFLAMYIMKHDSHSLYLISRFQNAFRCACIATVTYFIENCVRPTSAHWKLGNSVDMQQFHIHD